MAHYVANHSATRRATSRAAPAARASAPPAPDMVWIPGGEFRMGSDHHYPEEWPAHASTVGGFWMDRAPVTNARFAEFVRTTGHKTCCEFPLDPEHYPSALEHALRAGSLVFVHPTRPVARDDQHDWWRFELGADWRHPRGPASSLEGLGAHPVVHVTFSDASAFARWDGKALATEAEWELAARGGLDGATYAWGEEFMPRGRRMANTWQGEFPYERTECDGWQGTSPVGAFPANGYGLRDMIGNVWEWTSDWYQCSHVVEHGSSCCGRRPLQRGPMARSVDRGAPSAAIPRKVLKGGSYLCAPNYCRRYRPSARLPGAVDSSAADIGFRCIVRPRR